MGCLPVPYISHTDASSEDTTEGSIVTITCHEGHRMRDGTKEQNITCLNGEWFPETYNAMVGSDEVV